jgi:hypothetical protein
VVGSALRQNRYASECHLNNGLPDRAARAPGDAAAVDNDAVQDSDGDLAYT